MAWATALIRISSPSFDSNFSFQFCILFHTSSFIDWKELFLDLPTIEDSPKYISVKTTDLISILSVIWPWVGWLTFAMTRREDFSWFKCCPKAVPYCWIVFRILSQSLFVPFEKIMVSSTKNKCDNLGLLYTASFHKYH